MKHTTSPSPDSLPVRQAVSYTAPTVLAIIILLVLLGCGMWLLVYGTNLEQKTVITPNTTLVSPKLSPSPDVQSID